MKEKSHVKKDVKEEIEDFNFEMKNCISDDSSLNFENILQNKKRGRGGKEITNCPHTDRRHYAKVNTIF